MLSHPERYDLQFVRLSLIRGPFVRNVTDLSGVRTGADDSEPGDCGHAFPEKHSRLLFQVTAIISARMRVWEAVQGHLGGVFGVVLGRL